MKLTDTRDGVKTLQIDGKFLHSKYSPLREADKFIKSNLKTKTLLLVLGAGLGYIFNILEREHPDLEVVDIPYNRELGNLSWSLNPSKRKQWKMEEPLKDFINRCIDSHNIKGLQVLEWEPTARIFPEVSTAVNSIIVNRVRRINGNILTTARFGKKWIENSLKNYILTDNYVKSFKINRPVVIVASGKSLENSIENIKKARDYITLISLSSANCALDYYNLKPDLTFSTDPGYYSKLHLYGSNNTVAMPLTNSTGANSPVLLINQGNFFEEEIIEAGALPHINLRENGTVAGTALEFALKYSSGPVFLFGQDLASADIQSHISPYIFDNLLRITEYKKSPYYSTMYKRWYNSGVSFKTYRSWFSDCAAAFPNRVFRVNPASEEIEGIEDISFSSFLSRVTKNSRSQAITLDFIKIKTRDERTELVNNLLKKWINSINDKKIDENPLFYLISTSKYTDVNSKALPECQINTLRDEGKSESILFIKRLLKLYGRKLL